MLSKGLPDIPPLLTRTLLHLECNKRPVYEIITRMVAQGVWFRSLARRADGWGDSVTRLMERGARYEVEVGEGGLLDETFAAVVEEIAGRASEEDERA
jgi:hypothetical protein